MANAASSAKARALSDILSLKLSTRETYDISIEEMIAAAHIEDIYDGNTIQKFHIRRLSEFTEMADTLHHLQKAETGEYLRDDDDLHFHLMPKPLSELASDPNFFMLEVYEGRDTIGVILGTRHAQVKSHPSEQGEKVEVAYFIAIDFIYVREKFRGKLYGNALTTAVERVAEKDLNDLALQLIQGPIPAYILACNVGQVVEGTPAHNAMIRVGEFLTDLYFDATSRRPKPTGNYLGYDAEPFEDEVRS